MSIIITAGVQGPEGPPGATGATGPAGGATLMNFSPQIGADQWMGLPGVAWSATSNTSTLTANRLYYVGFSVQQDISVSNIACEVTTPIASSMVKLGVYSVGADMHPVSAPLIEVDTSSATGGGKILSVGGVTLPGLCHLECGHHCSWCSETW